jgi:hypothetical protein
MNNYYAPVTLPPAALLFDDYNQILNRQSFPYYILEPSALSSLATEFFKSLDVQPKFIVVFTHPNSTSPIHERLIHSDITLDNEQWKTLYCALNWEVNPRTVAEWFWLDMSTVPAVYPPFVNVDLEYQRLNGIHYGVRYQKGIPPTATILENAKLVGPHLVRVDIPHGVAYETEPNCSGDEQSQNQRVSVSIRFDESNWNSWEKCLHAFRSIVTAGD